MEFLPAIDIIDGKCVRLRQGKFEDKTIFSDDPVSIAKKWEEQGATRIHIVDLEGSRQGQPLEISTVENIKKAVNIPLQVGGGVRTETHIKAWIDAGADRVILGTSVAYDSNFAKKMFKTYDDKLILGIDAKNGLVAIKGWEEITEKKAIDFALEMVKLGAKRVIYTDISRDGMMMGVNIEAMKEMASCLPIPVIASGGVSSYKDIEMLSEISNIEGIIIGKALYTEDICLKEVLKCK